MIMRNLLFIAIYLFQISLCFSKPSRSLAYADYECSKHLSQLIDFENYKERSFAENVLDYHRYKKGEIKIQKKYLKDPRFKSLAQDPDHNFKISDKSKLEAVSGIEAERLGLIPGPIARGPPGSEFIDGKQNLWDVKSPVSPLKIDSWTFEAEIAGKSIITQLEKDPKMNILLNKSFMSYKDKESLEAWMKKNIPLKYKDRIIEVYFPSPFRSR